MGITHEAIVDAIVDVPVRFEGEGLAKSLTCARAEAAAKAVVGAKVGEFRSVPDPIPDKVAKKHDNVSDFSATSSVFYSISKSAN